MEKWMKIAGLLLGFALPVGVHAVDSITITIPSNQYAAVSVPYDTIDSSIVGLFGNLPLGSRVWAWDTATQKYIGFTKIRIGWAGGGTNTLARGSGVIIVLPANTQTNVVFSGSSSSGGIIHKVNGYTLVGYPYPVDVAFTNTQLAKTARNGEKIMVWDTNQQGWVSYTMVAGGWGSAANSLTLKKCSAFFYQSMMTTNIYEPGP